MKAFLLLVAGLVIVVAISLFLFNTAEKKNEATLSAPTSQADTANKPGPALTENHQPGKPCSDSADDYLRFIERTKAYARPVAPETLIRQILQNKSEDGQDPAADIAPDSDENDLRSRLREALNLAFLLDGLQARPLTVTIAKATVKDGVLVQELVFEDPFVGEFCALLQAPAGAGPFPGLVALHGHGDEPSTYFRDFGGGQLVSGGYLVIAPKQRASHMDDTEHNITTALLLNGHSLMTLRVYEALLVRKYLRSRTDVIPDRIGLVGHSGGAVAGNLIVRVADGFSALATDHVGTYAQYNPSGRLIDEMVPALVEFRHRINDFSSAPVPVFFVEYGYTESMVRVLAFFDLHLKGRTPESIHP